MLISNRYKYVCPKADPQYREGLKFKNEKCVCLKKWKYPIGLSIMFLLDIGAMLVFLGLFRNGFYGGLRVIEEEGGGSSEEEVGLWALAFGAAKEIRT